MTTSPAKRRQFMPPRKSMPQVAIAMTTKRAEVGLAQQQPPR